MAKHGLFIFQGHGRIVVQSPAIETQIVLVTRIGHASGEWMEFDSPVPTDKPGPQGFVGGNTYMRRTSNSMALNIASESDDDATEASNQRKKPDGRASQNDGKASQNDAKKKAQVKTPPIEFDEEHGPVDGFTVDQIMANLALRDWHHTAHFEAHVRKYWDDYKGRSGKDDGNFVETLTGRISEMRELLMERQKDAIPVSTENK